MCRWCRYGYTNGTSIYEGLRKVRVVIVLLADGLLFAYSCPGTVDLAEFTDWYDNEHVPNQLATPGFGATPGSARLMGRSRSVWPPTPASARLGPLLPKLTQAPK